VSWFHTREVASGAWLVAEPGHVNSWLVEGSGSAVLIDSGLGIAPIRPVVEALSHRPLRVVNTHHHFDHVGGNHEFSDISIHHLGADLLDLAPPPEVISAYLRYTRALLEAAGARREDDRAYLHLLTADADPRPLPPGLDESNWRILPTRATRLLSDGDRLALGERALTVLHTPGHSADSICLLDEREGLLFAGDTINTGPIYAQFPDADLDLLARSARRLAELESEIRLVFVSHFGRAVADPRLLGEVADGMEAIAGGDAVLSPARDCLGAKVQEARFSRFSVLLPALEEDPIAGLWETREVASRLVSP
jgi:glyoxylase-like metal-dependent hydrolase (beta-lactamase superfamily II)